MRMLDYNEIREDTDLWELFCRDYLEQLGFFIEVPPDRGADGGRDLLITEDVSGLIHRYKFRWLVSCKHFSHSNRSVSEKDEPNIQERLDSFNADGFIGFYSTLASSGLNQRLTMLRQNGKIKDYKIFDGKFIEREAMKIGFSQIILRYMPESYKVFRPPHRIFAQNVELNCGYCGKDLLTAIEDHEQGNVIEISSYNEVQRKTEILAMDFACREGCDGKVTRRLLRQYPKATDSWISIEDLKIPLEFQRHIYALINQLADGSHVYSSEAMVKEKELIGALAQITLRECSQKDLERVAMLASFPW